MRLDRFKYIVDVGIIKAIKGLWKAPKTQKVTDAFDEAFSVAGADYYGAGSGERENFVASLKCHFSGSDNTFPVLCKKFGLVIEQSDYMLERNKCIYDVAVRLGLIDDE